MALKQLLMTDAEVKTMAFTQAKLDKGLILDKIIRASQLKHIKPVLTKDLYELIETQNDSDTLTTANSLLLEDYIKPALAFGVKFQALPDIHTKATNVGVVRNNTEFGNSVSSAEREEKRSNAQDVMQTYIESMKEFIDDNSSDYPDYNAAQDVSNTTTILGGIVLDVSHNCSTRGNFTYDDPNYCR